MARQRVIQTIREFQSPIMFDRVVLLCDYRNDKDAAMQYFEATIRELDDEIQAKQEKLVQLERELKEQKRHA